MVDVSVHDWIRILAVVLVVFLGALLLAVGLRRLRREPDAETYRGQATVEPQETEAAGKHAHDGVSRRETRYFPTAAYDVLAEEDET